MQQRPTGVTIIAVLMLLGGMSLIAGGIGVLAIPIPVTDPVMQVLARNFVAIGVGVVLLGAAELAIGWGLYSLRNWARIATIILLAISAATNLVSGIALIAGFVLEGIRVSMPGPGVASLFAALLQGLVIWYLTKPDVVAAFETPFPIIDQIAPTVPPTVVSPPPPPPAPTAPVTAPSRSQPTEVYGMQPRPAAWLVARSGPQSGKNFGLKAGDTTVGRDTRRADIVLDTTTVSGEHARVRCEGGQFFLYDLASTNGTFINNRQIQKQMLRDGDIVRFGQAEFVFKSVS